MDYRNNDKETKKTPNHPRRDVIEREAIYSSVGPLHLMYPDTKIYLGFGMIDQLIIFQRLQHSKATASLVCLHMQIASFFHLPWLVPRH